MRDRKVSSEVMHEVTRPPLPPARCSIMLEQSKGQQQVAQRYLQSEAHMLARLEDLAILRATFSPAPTQTAPPKGAAAGVLPPTSREKRRWEGDD